MREILFKAKQIDNGEWVEGSFIDSGNHEQVFIYPHFGVASIMPCRSLVYHRMIAVDAETLCQYTGLKDKNGNKIWENDLINYDNSMYQCFWDTYNCEFGLQNELESFGLGHVNLNDAEVLGNIFDNPELLECE